MEFLDWLVVAAFIGSTICIGLYFTKRASRSEDDFFLAGRSLGWFVAGTSIVATTFSSDTPQWVAGHSRSFGIAGNWLWWCAGIGSIGAIFFLARYWRRTGAVTEVEFVKLRYGVSPSSNVLRIFKALSDGIVVNCTIMAAVTLAMAKVSTIVLGLSDQPLFALPFFGDVTPMVAILVVLTLFVLIYSAMSGLYGVVYTDLFQFFFAMAGSIALAVIMYIDVSSREGGMLQALQAAPDYQDGMLNMIPDLTQWNLGTMLFSVYIGFLWIMAFPTGGFYVQRLLSTKNEQAATKAFLWYNFAHFVLRSWPWIVVGMLAMVYYPSIEQSEGWHPENSYAMAISQFLPVGLKGLMVASFLAAYMSTISTHLNWGTSYIVHDFYEGFINKKASRRQIIRLSRGCMVAFLIFAAVIAAKLTAMLEAYKFLTQIWAGMGLVLIARWYWWRVTAGSEFICLLATISLTILLNISIGSGESAQLLCQGLFDWVEAAIHLPDLEPDKIGWLYFAIRVCIVTFGPLLIWVPYAFFVAREPNEAAIAFYKKMRIASLGWSRVEKITGLASPKSEFKMNLVGWIVTCFALYGILLGTGSLIFQQWTQAAIYLPIGIVASFYTSKILSGNTFKPANE